jgi:WD40 repeat protein/serine/threonine protein kinase/DNA-binding XRE family transcriptional regulator
MSQDTSFGAFVRQRRRELDLTQEELARRVGCAAITLRKIEADDLRASVQIAERLAMALAIPLTDRADFVRRARAVRPEAVEAPLVTPPPSMDEIGREDLTGRAIRGYALSERIGIGGMGSVYRAVQPNVEREVAVKIILPAFANHPDFIRRFEAEAQLVARLEHPHIVPLYDYWREPGVAYLVMRLLRGGNIQTLLGNGPLPVETTDHMLEQICSALNAAHRIGVIHRDLKPANVLLDEDNNAYLADFGIAKNLGNPDIENQTQVDAMLGSPQYMSPEQIRSLTVGPQTDVYCLGVMTYEMLTGSLPFTGPTPFDLIQQHMNMPMPPLSARQAGLPAALDAVIGRATAKDPADRYQDVLSLLSDFRMALGRIGDSHPVSITYDVEEDPEIEVSNPFKGLRAFSEADADTFFGRETLIQQLLARLSEGGDLSRFLAVIGPSGSGKSSVVRAGLVPALRRGGLPGSENWFIVDMLPGKHPFEELEAALLRVAVNPPESLLSQLKDGNRGLLRAVRRILPADNSVELVLVIDQFEEIFTLVEDEAERALLLENLATAVLDERSRLRVIITLRADFTDKPLRYVDFGEMLNRRFEFVLPLNPDEIERAVAGPAQHAGLKLEKGLVSTIIRETGNQPGALPLLQYALSELFEKREGRTLTNKAYREIGGVSGALGRSAELIFSRLDENGQAAARQVFLRLITLGEGTEDTRRRVLREELQGLGTVNSAYSMAIDRFGSAHLLTFDRDPLTRSATIEVAHEALLREWKRLREWLNESRTDLRLQRQLALAAQEWRTAQQDSSFLLTGARLEQFEGWATSTSVVLTRDERAYLDASISQRNQLEAAEAERQNRELETVRRLAETEKARSEEQALSIQQLRRRTVYLAIVMVMAIIAAIAAGMLANQNSTLAADNADIAEKNYSIALAAQRVAYARETAEANAVSQAKKAQEEALITSVRELAGEANANLEIDPERSILLALQAVNKTYLIDGTVQPEAEDALHRAVQASRIQLTLSGHTSSVWLADFSPDGKLIATASLDNTTKIWDASSGKELISLPASAERGVNGVAFSPDGKYVVTAGGDKIARVWEIASGKEILTLKGHADRVQYARFSPDGTRIVTSGSDGTARIWDRSSGIELITLAEEAGVQTLWASFSPDGSQIVTANTDYAQGWGTVWDLATGKKIFTLPGNATIVRCAIFSPDGKYIVITGDDQTAKLWDAQTGQKLTTFYGHTDSVASASFSPDGSRLATASIDRHVKIWDVATGRELFDIAGHSRDLNTVAFSPDGRQIVTASLDTTAKVWNVAPSRELLTLVNGPAIAFTEGSELAYSPDGKHLVTANSDPAPKVWDVKTGELLFSLNGHSDNVTFATYSVDGTRIATASNDGTAKIWDATSGRELMTFVGHKDFVFGAAFSPDGTRLATSSFDKTAKIWDIATGRELMSLPHRDWVFSVVFSPDGKRIATSCADTTASVWELETGKQILTLENHKDLIDQIVYSPSGIRLATASFDGTARVWDAATGKEIFVLASHSASVFDVVYSPDGKFLATASADKTAKVWDAQTGQELLTLNAPGPLSGVAFSPDGAQLAAAGRDGTTRIFLLRIEDLIALAKSRLTRTWKLSECQEYLHTDACPEQP